MIYIGCLVGLRGCGLYGLFLCASGLITFEAFIVIFY